MNDGCVYLPAIIGNDSLKARLGKDISSGRLSHAYIIEGKKGSGRHTIAKNIIAAIECDSRQASPSLNIFGEPVRLSLPCGECPSCQKILSDKSPDVSIIGIPEDRVTIGVETSRDLKADMYTAPNELSVKAYVIEDADLMTEEAQNALLLSFEEPPEYVLCFILCESSMNLLETIRSRAQALRTELLSEDKIEEYLLLNYPVSHSIRSEDPKAWRTLLFVANGCIGKAIELLDKNRRETVLENRSEVKKLISVLLSADRAAAVKAISVFGKKRQSAIEKIELLQFAVRDLLLLKKTDNAPLCFYEDAEEALELSTRYTSRSLLMLYDASETAKRDLLANANVKLALTNMILNAGLL